MALLILVGLGLLGFVAFQAVSFLEAEPRTGPAVDQKVVDEVMTYVNVWREDDPLVTLPSGAQAKASNVYGVEIGGVRYFYQVRYHASFDPARSQGFQNYEILAVVDANTENEVIIYREKR